MKKYLFLVLYSVLIISGSFAYALTAPTSPPTTNREYTVLAPLPGTTKNCTGDKCTADLNSYLSGFLGFAIGVGSMISMLILAYYGFQYALSDSASAKMQHKEKIWDILGGFFLIISAYAIVRTINPKILPEGGFVIDINTPFVQGGSTVSTGTGTPSSIQTRMAQCTSCGPLTGTSYTISESNINRLNCTTCVPMGNLPTSSSNLNKNIEPDLKNRLVNLNSGLVQQNISWGVTEAYPPVTNHDNGCHYNGTCIDAKITNATAQNVRAFIATASNNGLTAQLEFATDRERDSMRSALISSGMSPADANASVITVAGINGSHFSVYKK